jgi:hypothetical protein
MGATAGLIFAFGLLAVCVGVFVWISRRIRRGGGGATVGLLGATHEMLSTDRRKAGETIIRRNAGDSESGEDSSDPLARRRSRDYD